MGNAMGRSKKAKVMKIDGETFKLKTPARAHDVVKDHPGHVLLDSQSVKHFGLRARPLESHHELRPKKIYFLVELPKAAQPKPPPLPRRAQSSGLRSMNGMSAKERLDFLMLSKRSVSDLSSAKRASSSGPAGLNGSASIKMRLPKAQWKKLNEESNDGDEVAEKILSLYMGSQATVEGGGTVEDHHRELHNDHTPQRKRVSFYPVEQEEIREEAT